MSGASETLDAIRDLVAAAEASGWDTTENAPILNRAREAYAALCFVMAEEADDEGGAMNLIFRPLGSPALVSIAPSAVARAAASLDLSRGIPKHPGKAEQLMLGDLKLRSDSSARASDIDCAADLSGIIDDAAPDELTYFIPTHDGPPRTGRETVAAQPGARKPEGGAA